jgi:hypothetical protein
MTDFQVFEGGFKFLLCMQQMVDAVKEGRVTSFPYIIFVLNRKADARDVLLHYRSTMEKCGFNPERVVGFRDPVSKTWIVLVPRDQNSIAFDEAWEFGSNDPS